MDAIMEYLNQPITLREVLQSPIIWITAFCGFLLYKLYFKAEPQISQRAQSQNGGKGNTQSMNETHKVASDNKIHGSQKIVNKNTKIGRQHNIQGDATLSYGKISVQ